jgi:hypothetical protein
MKSMKFNVSALYFAYVYFYDIEHSNADDAA